MTKEFSEDKKMITLKNKSPSGEPMTLDVRKGFSTESGIMDSVLTKIWHFSRVESDPLTPIYLRGETGVGKTELAEIFHYNSKRKEGKFIDVNCATIPEYLFESEFFGIDKNIATGVAEKEGIFQFANKGTVFLDEINKLPMEQQGKFLTAIEKQQARRVGGKETYDFDIRLISASNESLMKLVQEGEFREDLFYRLEGVNILIPPLRDREKDILILAENILEKHNTDKKEEEKITFSDEFKWALENYNYPGNIRQLKTIIGKCVGQCVVEKKQFIDLQIAFNASNQGEWMGFGLDGKSDLVRFYENYLHEMDFKNKSLHDLAVAIVSSFQDDNMMEGLSHTDEVMRRFKHQLGLNGNDTDGINHSIKELINKLNKALDGTLRSNHIERNDVINFLNKTNDLSIFIEAEEIKLTAIKRLRTEKTLKEIGEMLGVSIQAVAGALKRDAERGDGSLGHEKTA